MLLQKITAVYTVNQTKPEYKKDEVLIIKTSDTYSFHGVLKG
jgi:hypothetical protein